MFRSSSPFTTDGSSYAESLSGYPSMDESASQSSRRSRPSGRSIYLQRKEYAASVRQIMDKTQYRVEHLFTFELDGKQLRSVSDCVRQLQLLEEMGRVWGQNMLLEVQGPKFMLVDIETKMELESIAIADILELKALLNSGAFNSLLMVSVQGKSKENTSVFVFQCEDIRADLIQKDLSRALSNKSNSRGPVGPVGPIGPVGPPPPWTPPGWENNNVMEPDRFAEEEEEPLRLSPQPYTQLDRDVEILNHLLNDIEIVMGQISAALANKTSKKKKKKKAIYNMPSAAEFASCLQKIKYGFNLLAELNGQISNPSSGEYVHFFFTMLAFVAPQSPVGLPMTIVVPLLTPESVQLLGEVVTPEEDQLWQSMGEAWNVPSNQWPNADVQPYVPDFLDGWMPPALSAAPETKEPLSRVEPLQSASGRKSAEWRPPPPPQQDAGPSEPQYVRVIHDFTSRNSKELTVRKGETVELLDMSRQWWKVRDARREVGYVPNNVLELYQEQLEQFSQQPGGSAVLTKRSRPAEVKVWLEFKDFSQTTVGRLGGLSGATLLGMSKEELRALCPEEGARVFFQLQMLRSSMAAAN